MTLAEALVFVEHHGVVLASAKGPVPRMSEAIAGEPIRGSWWAHPKSHAIFSLLDRLADSPDVLVCRLVDGKVTFVHRRLWPALVRIADRFSRDRLAQVHEEHTPSGRHRRTEVPFPDWVPDAARGLAATLTEDEALRALGAWTSVPASKARSRGLSR
jgi:hypothetical protein